MGNAYQTQNQKQAYFLTFQVVGWADIFTRQVYGGIIIDNLSYCRDKRELNVFAFVIMTNHFHNNPVTAGWVEHPEDYLYSSARNYAG